MNLKIRLSDDTNYYIIYIEGRCRDIYIVDRITMDELLQNNNLEPVKEDGKLNYAQYKTLLNFIEKKPRQAEKCVNVLNLANTNTYYIDGYEMSVSDKINKALGGVRMYTDPLCIFGIKHLDDDKNKEWHLYYRKNHSDEGVKCEFVQDGYRRFIVFKSKTIANAIKNTVRTHREQNHGEQSGSTYVVKDEDTKNKTEKKIKDNFNGFLTKTRRKLIVASMKKKPLVESGVCLHYAYGTFQNDEYGQNEANKNTSRRIRKRYKLGMEEVDNTLYSFYNRAVDEQPLKIYLKHKNNPENTQSK